MIAYRCLDDGRLYRRACRDDLPTDGVVLFHRNARTRTRQRLGEWATAPVVLFLPADGAPLPEGVVARACYRSRWLGRFMPEVTDNNTEE